MGSEFSGIYVVLYCTGIRYGKIIFPFFSIHNIYG